MEPWKVIQQTWITMRMPIMRNNPEARHVYLRNLALTLKERYGSVSNFYRHCKVQRKGGHPKAVYDALMNAQKNPQYEDAKRDKKVLRNLEKSLNCIC